MDNLPSDNSSQEQTKDTSQGADEKSEEASQEDVVLTIKQLVIKQAHVNLLSDKLGQKNFTLKDIVLLDLKGTPDEISQQVIKQLSKTVSKEAQSVVKSELQKEAKSKLKEKASELLDGKLKDLKLKFK